MENRKKAHTVFYSILSLWIKSLLAMVHVYVILDLHTWHVIKVNILLYIYVMYKACAT